MKNEMNPPPWRNFHWIFWTFLISLINFLALGFYLNRELEWNWPVVSFVLKKYSLIAVIVWLFVVTLGSMSSSGAIVTLSAYDYLKRKLTGKLPRTPLERLQEEFEAAHPGRTLKDDPPEPVIPPPRDDNPYSYR